ncbi:uncharacterized protein LOC131674775 [Phymastichus coffea]|uniref:uncharacterized protein LOC131674775 n=1 Tax=Phymastichus coffea TaxID=108790 RepID=UPI00273AF7E3|nr:uncharacterized protein LOC131674775 [Phymastichus coffea]
MASNSNEWAALPQRKRPDKRTRDNQSKVLAQLNEMFDTTFGADIVATVAHHFQYKLEPAIETLITLSSQPAIQPSNTDFLETCTSEDDLWQTDEFPPTENPWIESGIIDNEENEDLKKYEALKDSDSPQSNDQEEKVYDDDKDSLSHQIIGGQARKIETASLCGLKVQYRPKGIDYKSDDDADVVIEDEASDYKVDPEPISVCHFLANTTQCPPKNTFPKVECISTPSPPCTPRHQLPTLPSTKPLTAYEKDIQRIESDIAKGWKILIILRGCPGSGKTYLAQSIVNHTMHGDFQSHIFSADHYLSRINGGVYAFDPSKLHDAHADCQSKVANAVRLGISPIIVDNTNTQAWEMKPYALMGVDNGYIIETLEPDTPWAHDISELAKRNQHGVPKLKIKLMINRFERNISGDRLIRMFNLSYAPYHRPPQIRKLPPLSGLKSTTHIRKENALSTIAKEYSNLETLCNTDVIPDPLPCFTTMLSIEGNSFKEDNLIELANLGAIGSERKIPNSEEVNADQNPVDMSKLGAIGSEKIQKISKEEESKEIITNLVETEPLAKLSLNKDNKTEAKMSRSGEFDTCQEEEDYFLDAEELVSRDSESSKNSATPSDHSTDFEKVDMNDFGGNPEKKTNEKTLKNEVVVGGLGMIFSYIKNSFLGNEKEESVLSPKVENEETASKTNNEPVEEVKKESEELTTNILPVDEEEHDTLSQKLSNHTACDVINKNLTINVQQNIDVVDEARSDNDKVVKELLEACSEFQLIENLDYTLRQEEDDDESIISEKSFAQELKNLQDFMKSKENDAGAAKESIDTILNDKNNILKEQQNHNSPPAEVLSDDNGNAVNNINLISWHESPFPVENVPNLLINIEDEAQVKSVLHDKETFTDPYDFNVAFIGADDFKVIKAHNRSINEGNLTVLDDTTNLRRKLMLHKGTMTRDRDIAHLQAIFNRKVDPQQEYRGEELVKNFSHIPSKYVLEVYDNLCQRDFDWATEYLMQLNFEDVNMAMSMTESEKEKTLIGLEEKVINLPEDGTAQEVKPTPKQFTNSSESTTKVPQKQSRKSRKYRDKNFKSQKLEELQRELQEKFVLSKDSYPSHTLRVKRWKNRDFSPKRQPEQNLISFDNNQPKLDEITRFEHPAAMDNDQETTSEETTSEEDSSEEIMELKLGYEFIRTLEAEFGKPTFPKSDGLFPVIKIRKSMAQELYALWIDSMQQQLWTMQKQLDGMIARDADFARKLEAEQDEEVQKAIAISEPEVPNFKEIMDMEMALAVYLKNPKKDCKSASLKQMEVTLTRDTLVEMFPDCDRDMINDIYTAHNCNFSETVTVIKENCFTTCKLTMADILKKRKHLFDEVQKERDYQKSQHNDKESKDVDEARGDMYESYRSMSYEDAMKKARESRSEAQYQLILRNENYRKANEHYRKKNPQVAAYYSDVAKLHIRNMEAANSAAASAILAAQTGVLDVKNTIDLHYLHVSEAKVVLQIFLDRQLSQLSPGGRKIIFIITGRGLRSVNGQSKIKPAIAKELNHKRFRFTEVNPGMLKVVLKKK